MAKTNKFRVLKKSQISVEFIIILAVMLIVFLGVFIVADKRTAEMYSVRTKLYAKMEADKFASDVNGVFLAGSGTGKISILPSTLKDNSAYNISIYPSEHKLQVVWQSSGIEDHYSAALIAGNISGVLSSINYPVNLSNINGGIVIS
ncbi:TPA: hypothetical protein HA246_04020 [Candidatus Woesearchaeota archaeon]|nr:hypothetical protein [Candidatus Woesearchaeota archaeon]